MASPPSPIKKVLVPIAAGSEPVEASVPIDILRRASAEVTVAAAGVDGLLVEAMYGVKIVADANVADCADASYDLVALPGGIPGTENLAGCAALESIVRRHALKGGLYAAICAAPPLALARWGLLDGVKVLVPIAAGSEPLEASVPIDILRRAGADVTVAAAGVDGGLLVEAMYGVKIVADASVADCADASYDLVALPGGIPGTENLAGCAALESIVRRHALKGGLYAAICAAPPLALARWGLLDGVKATAHPAFVDKFPAEVTAVDANVVVDGKVVTARGPATAMEFALALVEQLYGKEKFDQIAKPMLVRHEPGYSFKELNPIQWQCSGTPKVLIPLANGNEEMEVIMIVDALRRANADVVVASAEDGVEVVARYNTRIVADMLLDAAADQQFDLIIVPGGMPGAKTLAGKEKLVALLNKQAEANKPYGAICAATAQVLEPHGLLKGKKATTYTSTVGMLADPSECENRVLVDRNLFTSRSPGTAMECAMAIVEKLLGREAAREVAEALLLV